MSTTARLTKAINALVNNGTINEEKTKDALVDMIIDGLTEDDSPQDEEVAVVVIEEPGQQ